jgi:hypothetical protein
MFFSTRSEHSTFSLELNPASLKAALYGLTFKKFAFLITVLQVFFLIALLLLHRKKIVSSTLFTILTIANSVVFAWIAFPFTVVSQYKTSEVNAFIKSFPAGYPIPHAKSAIRTEASSDSASISIHGYRKFYEKEITIQDHVITPTLASDYDLFLNDQQLRSTLKNHPFAFVSNKTLNEEGTSVKVQEFSPNRFAFSVQTDNDADLNLFQQYNHNWQAKVNEQVVPIQKSNIAFMKVAIPKGVSTIEFSYRPKTVYLAMAIAICSLLAAILYFVFNKKKAND